MRLSRSELSTAKCSILHYWKTHLKDKGVGHPKKYLTPLAILHMIGPNNAMSQQELTDTCAKAGVNYDRQIRHLARHGWWLTTGHDHPTRKWIMLDGKLGDTDICLKSVDTKNPMLTATIPASDVPTGYQSELSV